MNIQGPDGAIVQFPEGTDPGIVNDVMSKHFGGAARGNTGDAEGGPMTLTVRPSNARELPPAPAQEPSAPAPVPGKWESAGRGLKQGLTFNFGDELSGAVSASPLPEYLPGPINLAAGAGRLLTDKIGLTSGEGRKTYDRVVAEERAANEAAQRENPGSYLAGELGGAGLQLPFAPALAPFRAAQGAGVLARLGAAGGNLATTGAAYGAVSGFGGGQGDLTEQGYNAGYGAAVGAAAGPVIGGAISGAVRGAGAVGRYVGNHVAASRNPQQVADKIVGRALRNDAPDQIALEAHLRDANLEYPRPQPNPVGAPIEVQGPPSLGGQRLTAADIAGPNTQGVAGNVARTPGPGRAPARQFLEDRQIGTDTAPSQGDRITGRLDSILGDKGMVSVADDIIAKRSAQASKGYESAFSKPIDYVGPEGQQLLSLLDRVPNSARAKANEILKIEDKAGTQLIFEPTPDAAGNYALKGAPNARQWEYIKRGLDTAIDGTRDPITGRLDTYGNAVAGLKRDMLTALDKANPTLANARKVFAGHSEMLDALQSGKDIWAPSMTPEALAKQVKALSPGELEMFRLGAANGLRDKLANSGDGINKVRAAFGSPALREKMRAIAPDEKSMSTLTTYLKNEDAMFKTRGQMGGSPTAERLGDAENIGSQLVEALHTTRDVARGNVPALLMTAARQIAKINPEHRGAVLDEVRKVILNPDPSALAGFRQRMELTPMDNGTRRAVTGLVSKVLPRALTNQATEERPRQPSPPAPLRMAQ